MILTASITDAAIRRHSANPEIHELRDPRHPIRFRWAKCRQRGSVHLLSLIHI